MSNGLIVILGLAVLVALVGSTGLGRRLRRRLPIPALRPGRALREDREYLLRVCDGDAERVQRLLDLERAQRPGLTEAAAYRRAIRRYLRDKI